MDITKVHYDPAAAITVKAKKKSPPAHSLFPPTTLLAEPRLLILPLLTLTRSVWSLMM